MQKRIHELKAGDIVTRYGANFRILYNARESQAHKPKSGPMVSAFGPCEVAYAEGQWLSGSIERGYFGPDCNWIFQGNFLAGPVTVLSEG